MKVKIVKHENAVDEEKLLTELQVELDVLGDRLICIQNQPMLNRTLVVYKD